MLDFFEILLFSFLFLRIAEEACIRLSEGEEEEEKEVEEEEKDEEEDEEEEEDVSSAE